MCQFQITREELVVPSNNSILLVPIAWCRWFALHLQWLMSPHTTGASSGRADGSRMAMNKLEDKQ